MFASSPFDSEVLVQHRPGLQAAFGEIRGQSQDQHGGEEDQDQYQVFESTVAESGRLLYELHPARDTGTFPSNSTGRGP